jgi:hypothetical protein
MGRAETNISVQNLHASSAEAGNSTSVLSRLSGQETLPAASRWQELRLPANQTEQHQLGWLWVGEFRRHKSAVGCFNL